jgi:hypothetical protein
LATFLHARSCILYASLCSTCISTDRGFRLHLCRRMARTLDRPNYKQLHTLLK